MDQSHLVELSTEFACYSASPHDAGQHSELRRRYSEIFLRRRYLHAGLDLGATPFVVDVGGNVGLFTLFVAARWPTARVLAFEPIPCLATAFRDNVRLHRATGATVLQLGLGGSRQVGVPFTYYRLFPARSTRYPEQRRPHRDQLAQVMGAELADHVFAGECVTVDVERLSDLLGLLGETGRIDLLKVTAEGAELDVLRGIDDRDWPRVRNVVLEAHDLDGRLIVVVGLLTAHGFRVTTELNTDLPEGFDTYLVWACRGA